MITLLNHILARFNAWVVYHRTKAELAKLDDRSLADMGFHRSEIEFMARRAAATAK